MTTARHSADSAEWYTPEYIVDAARQALGGIDLDPASHAEAAKRIGAARYYSLDHGHDGSTLLWSGRVFVNPPGGYVAKFWSQFIHQQFDASIWVGFSIEQFQTLQSHGFDRLPFDFPTCYPRRRVAFVENRAMQEKRRLKCEAKGQKFNPTSTPSHANYISYRGPDVEAFIRAFSPLGAVRV